MLVFILFLIIYIGSYFTMNYKDKCGWRPGAVSKRLLKKLNKAKLRTSTVAEVKLAKRTKKRNESKPLIVVGKTDGEYKVEIQVSSENDTEQYSPLIYKIESANNKAKLKKREKIQKRLVEAAIKDVWSDPYDPGNCKKVCLKAYYEAMGIIPEGNLKAIKELDETNCSCDDEEVSSSCDSSEIDWEIQFSPPYLCEKDDQCSTSLVV